MIHYHGGPLSGPSDNMSRFWRGRHAMVSFAYPNELPVVAESCQSFALDNGAFTTWKSGKAFDLEGYTEWVEEWHKHPGFDWCLGPDVIDGDEHANNMLLCEWIMKRGSHYGITVPVWHLHESLDRLRYLCGAYQRVALGSSGKWSQPGNEPWWERMREVMRTICDGQGRPRCKLHGLRMLNPEIFTRLPFASADSTNAAQNAGSFKRFGSYTPPHAWQRATVIADRIESHQSAAAWSGENWTTDLFELAM